MHEVDRALADDEAAQEAVAVAEAKLAASRAFTHQTVKESVGSMYDTASGSSIYRVNPRRRPR